MDEPFRSDSLRQGRSGRRPLFNVATRSCLQRPRRLRRDCRVLFQASAPEGFSGVDLDGGETSRKASFTVTGRRRRVWWATTLGEIG